MRNYQSPCLQRTSLLSLIVLTLSLQACSDYTPPSSPAEAARQAEQMREQADVALRRANEAGQAATTVLTRIGEATQEGADKAKSGLETLGDVSSRGLSATRTGLETLGQTVIDIRDNLSPPEAPGAENDS